MGEHDESPETENYRRANNKHVGFFMSAGSSPELQRRLSSPAGILFKTMEGYILAWRKFTETSFYKNSYCFHLAMHLLFKANHKENRIIFNGQEIEIKRGQAIVGRHIIASETGIAEGTVYDKLKILEKCGFCNIKSNNRFSVITILNYDSYQSNNKPKQQPKQQPSNNQPTTSQQPANTNNNDNNDKQCNNDNKEKDFLFLKNEVFNMTFQDYLTMRQQIKKPATARAQELVLKALHMHSISDAIAMLEQSIVNSWQGVFPLKKGIISGADKINNRKSSEYAGHEEEINV
jgi:hypothetical protein